MDDEEDEIIDEEDEESSEDEVEFENQSNEDISTLLTEYQQMMSEKIEEEKRAEKIKKQINNLSIDEVVNMIENNEKCENKKSRSKKKKNKKRDQKFEEEIIQKEEVSDRTESPIKDKRTYQVIENTEIELKDCKNSNIPHEESVQNITLMHQSKVNKSHEIDNLNNENQYQSDEKSLLNAINGNNKFKERLIPNFPLDWLVNLKKRLSV